MGIASADIPAYLCMMKKKFHKKNKNLESFIEFLKNETKINKKI
jgi:hypothetical protein